MMELRTAALVCLPTLVLAGCGAANSAGPSATTEDPASESELVQLGFESLPSCGEVNLGLDGTLSDKIVDCMNAARGSEAGAQASVTNSTDEGDPITLYYRYEPGQSRLRIVEDTTADNYGPREWRLRTCPDAQSLTDPGQCDIETLASEPPAYEDL